MPPEAQPTNPYEQMTLEELDAVLEGRVPAPSEPTDAPAGTEAPPVAAQPPAAPSEQLPPQPTSEATPAPSAEAPSAEQPTEPAEFDARREIELLEARLEQESLGRKHWEQVAGRHGSKIGFLEEQLRARAAMPSAPPLEPSDADEPASTSVPSAPPPAGRDRLATWAVAQAARGAFHSFVQQNPDYAEHAKGLGEYARAHGVDPDAILLSNDPGQVEAEVNGLLSGHLLHIQQQKVAARITELQAKRAESTARAADARRAASTSAAGVRSAPPPQAKTLKDMSLEELDAVMDQQTGGRW